VPATGLEPLTAKLISLNEIVETGNDEIHHSSLMCLVNELAHGLAVPEQVQMISRECAALLGTRKPDAFRPPPPRCRTAGNAAGA